MDIVTSAALRVVEQYGGRTYELRPPTFGEAGDLAARHIGTIRPGAAMIAETVRQALEARLQGEAAPFVAAITAHEEADDLLQSLLITRPMDSEPESAKTEWRRELRAAQVVLLAADRRRQLAEQRVADAPEVVAVRTATMRAQMEDRLHTVRICLVRWSGAELPEWAPGADGKASVAELAELPASDLGGLGDRCQGLLQPSRSAEKN